MSDERFHSMLQLVKNANYKFHGHISDDERLRFNYQYTYLDANDPVRLMALKIIMDRGSYDQVLGIRVNRFLPDSFIEPHFDMVFPTWDTLVISLTDDHRFGYRSGGVTVVGQPMVFMPPGTMHRVDTGDKERYSLVCHVRKEPESVKDVRLTLPWTVGEWADVLKDAVAVSRYTGRDVEFMFSGCNVVVDAATNLSASVFDSKWVKEKDLRRIIKLSRYVIKREVE